MGPEDNFCSTKIQKNKDSVLALLSDLIWGFRRCEFKIRTMEPKKYCPFLHFSSKEKGFPVVKSGVWGHFPHYSRVRLNWEVALDFRFGHWKWPNREWEKGHFSKWKWPFPHSRLGQFQCPKRKSKTTSQYKYTPIWWEIWPQEPLLTDENSFSHEEKWEKGP